MGDTTISVPESLADELYDRKARGESYADVIRRLLEQAEGRDHDGESESTYGRAGRAGMAGEAGSVTARSEPSDPPADSGQPTAEDSLEALVTAVADDVLPGSGHKHDDRRDALRAAVAYLQEHGDATPADFRTDVYPDHPAHYTDGDDPARSWWKNCIYKGLAELADRTEEIRRADTSGEWSYRGAADR